MSDLNPHLNDLGLVSAVDNFISLTRRENELWEAKQKAEQAVTECRQLLTDVRKRLAAHTKATKRPEIVVLKNGTAAYIPVPREGYSDPEVYPEFATAKGLRFLVSDDQKS